MAKQKVKEILFEFFIKRNSFWFGITFYLLKLLFKLLNAIPNILCVHACVHANLSVGIKNSTTCILKIVKDIYIYIYIYIYLISQCIIYQKKAQSTSKYTRTSTQSTSSIHKRPKPTTRWKRKHASKYTKKVKDMFYNYELTSCNTLYLWTAAFVLFSD